MAAPGSLCLSWLLKLVPITETESEGRQADRFHSDLAWRPRSLEAAGAGGVAQSRLCVQLRFSQAMLQAPGSRMPRWQWLLSGPRVMESFQSPDAGLLEEDGRKGSLVLVQDRGNEGQKLFLLHAGGSHNVAWTFTNNSSTKDIRTLGPV